MSECYISVSTHYALVFLCRFETFRNFPIIHCNRNSFTSILLGAVIPCAGQNGMIISLIELTHFKDHNNCYC